MSKRPEVPVTVIAERFGGPEGRRCSRIGSEICGWLVGLRIRPRGRCARYAGRAPATRGSGSSIRGEHTGPASKQLKRAFYLAAFACLS